MGGTEGSSQLSEDAEDTACPDRASSEAGSESGNPARRLGVTQRGPCSPHQAPDTAALMPRPTQPTTAHRCPQSPRGTCWRVSYLCHVTISYKSLGIWGLESANLQSETSSCP